VAIDPARTFKPINIALLTVSDTRGPEDDTSGDILAERIKAAGHYPGRARHREGRCSASSRSRLNNWIDDRTVDAVGHHRRHWPYRARRDARSARPA